VFKGSSTFSDHVSHGKFDIARLGFCGWVFVHNSLIINSFINVTGCGGMGRRSQEKGVRSQESGEIKKDEEDNSLPIPCSLFPIPYSLFPVPCSLMLKHQLSGFLV
jgi:hypothetical protein